MPVVITLGVVQLTVEPEILPPALAPVGTKPAGRVLWSVFSVIDGPRLKIVMI